MSFELLGHGVETRNTRGGLSDVRIRHQTSQSVGALRGFLLVSLPRLGETTAAAFSRAAHDPQYRKGNVYQADVCVSSVRRLACGFTILEVGDRNGLGVLFRFSG